ncbi:hypothetical protein IFM89_021476 [Coptis chinensis]|uniref:Heparan-alpha-glucosaminide N-acetyltransferase catalytic domain-containing protein n=1 Tax=Coptis chinensis TaxID=261450 RepID=A0A835ISE9_9MAGN|nr:hypothetical protein IFM89_021476 [Coptis chinensis]
MESFSTTSSLVRTTSCLSEILEMSDYEQLPSEAANNNKNNNRLASLDVFRGLSVFLMIFVDYGGSLIPFIAHSPWNGLHLADFVMPFFLFIVGLSLALVYKNVENKVEATRKAVVRAIQLFVLGIVLQGGYFHGLNSLTFGVDIERIRWLGILQVNCEVRGDLGPACNAAGLIDRHVLGVKHLYRKPGYRNLKECSNSENVSEGLPPWCLAPFDPEGILSTLTAAVTCIIGLHYGHVLVQLEGHKRRLFHWLLISFTLFGLGLILSCAGIPLNKSLYTTSYMLLTSASAGITFSALYVLVDIYGYKRLTFVLEWMGIHSLGIFVLVTSNLAVIAIQGFYWSSPKNNIVSLQSV